MFHAFAVQNIYECELVVVAAQRFFKELSIGLLVNVPIPHTIGLSRDAKRRYDRINISHVAHRRFGLGCLRLEQNFSLDITCSALIAYQGGHMPEAGL